MNRLDPILGLLFLGVIAMAALALRRHLLRSTHFTDLHCPRCGSSLKRIHRHPRDRLLNLWVPVRRYICSNRTCRWSGLRIRQPWT
jgi:hypothetical protein